MIKYYIRTTGERKLDDSYNQIPYVKLIDKEHRYIDFFVDELERVGTEDCVIIEDDCVLCKDFKNKIEQVIAAYPDRIINFFYWGQRYFKTYECGDYLQNQCTYYPKGLSQQLAREMRQVHKDNPTLCTDEVENLALKNMNVKHIVYRPCLVQHLNFDTFLNHKVDSEILRTPFFIDYLEECGVDYNTLNPKTDKIKMFMLKVKYKQHISAKRKEWERNIQNDKILCKNNKRQSVR